MLLSSLSSVLGFIYHIMRLGREFFSKWETYKRTKKINNRYREGDKAVKDGNVDKINDIFKGR